MPGNEYEGLSREQLGFSKEVFFDQMHHITSNLFDRYERGEVTREEFKALVDEQIDSALNTVDNEKNLE